MSGHHDALLIDVGVVLTTDIFPSFDAYCAREGLDVPSFRELYFETPEVQRLLHRLEVGELHADEAQEPLADLLGLPRERADGLVPGLYQEVEFVTEMTDAVEALRRGGVRAGVLSNSWWFPMYEKPLYERACDVQVISGSAPRPSGCSSSTTSRRICRRRARSACRSGFTTRVMWRGRSPSSNAGSG